MLDRKLCETWHPWMNRATEEFLGKVVLVEGKDHYLTDSRGKTYLDAASGVWNVSMGYSDPAIRRAISEQLNSLPVASSVGYSNKPEIELSGLLGEISGFLYSHVFYASGGSEAVETALKMARQYFWDAESTDKCVFVSLAGSYHGSTYGALSITGLREDKGAFGPVVPECYLVEGPDCDSCVNVQGECCGACINRVADAIDTIESTSNKKVAGFIFEPIMGAFGVFPLPDPYLRAVATMCRVRDILLIADEIATGIGRTGAWFAALEAGCAPDIICIGKGLTGGYFPMSAVLCKEAVYTNVNRNFFDHGFTASGHPLGCAAALATIHQIRHNGILNYVSIIGEYLGDGLRSLQTDWPDKIRAVTGKGLMWGVSLSPSRQNVNFRSSERLTYLCRIVGLIVFPNTDESIALFPSFTFTETTVDELISKLRRAISLF